MPIERSGDGGRYWCAAPAEMESCVHGSLQDMGSVLYGGADDDHRYGWMRMGMDFWCKAVHACGSRELCVFVGGGRLEWSVAPGFARRVAADLQALLDGIGPDV